MQHAIQQHCKTRLLYTLVKKNNNSNICAHLITLANSLTINQFLLLLSVSRPFQNLVLSLAPNIRTKIIKFSERFKHCSYQHYCINYYLLALKCLNIDPISTTPLLLVWKYLNIDPTCTTASNTTRFNEQTHQNFIGNVINFSLHTIFFYQIKNQGKRVRNVLKFILLSPLHQILFALR